jgi:hypothetical protein
MASRRGLVLVFLCAVLAGVGAWRLGWLNPAPPAPKAAPRPAATPTPPPFESPWATEQDWIVDTITRDVREMAAFATTGQLPSNDLPAVKPGDLHFDDYLFSPRAYEPVASAALGTTAAGSPSPASPDPEDARLLAALLDLRPAVLVREDRTLSRKLEADLRDAAAHERAALLLGAFALRDDAGRHGDYRPALCRMTAHLAFARALRGGGEPGLAGRFAETLLVTLVLRERDALTRLDALAAVARSRAERAWVRALRLRNTGDWRIARDAKDLTLLETLAEFQALAWVIDDTTAFTWLEKRRPEWVADWAWIALDCGFSVETGNRFAEMAPAFAMSEAAEVLQAMRDAPPEDTDRLLEALNERPRRLVSIEGGKPRLAVLGWGLWADRGQRHLLFGLETASYHLAGVLGMPGQSTAYDEYARGFSRLEMFPLLLRYMAADANHYRAAMAAVRELALHSPERLTGGCWALIRAKSEYGPVPADLPDQNTWFRPALPLGTALDFSARSEVVQALVTLRPEPLRALHDLAPYHPGIASRVLQPAGVKTLAEQASVYGPLADFNVYAMRELAMAAWYDTPEFRRRQGALCELIPEQCFRLGYRLAELGLDDEAAVAYQKGFDRARDRVSASHRAQWLVTYYYEHGNVEKAEAVAREVASTGSCPGLLVLANLMERRGKLDAAEEDYRQVYERYDVIDDLVGFYYRQARVAKKAAYEAKLRTTLAQALPSGLEPLDRAALPPKPTDGVVVKEENDNTKRYAIKWGNVIVGLDGFRVRNVQAFGVVRTLSYSPHMKLVVWRGKSYDDIDVELWDRRFRIGIDDLKPAEKPKDETKTK